MKTSVEFADCRRLFLKNYRVDVRMGVHAFEKKGPQPIVINVELFVPIRLSTPKADRLDEVVDYDFIRECVAARVAQRHIQLQETLCDELLADMLAHPSVRAARVSTQKPTVYPDCDAVGVEVFGLKPAPPKKRRVKGARRKR